MVSTAGYRDRQFHLDLPALGAGRKVQASRTRHRRPSLRPGASAAPLVEVVGSGGDAARCARLGLRLLCRAGQATPAAEEGDQSFIANRPAIRHQDEANRLIDAGVCDYADIDTAMTRASACAGPSWARPCAPIWAAARARLKHRLEHLGWRGGDATKTSLSAAVGDLAGAYAHGRSGALARRKSGGAAPGTEDAGEISHSLRASKRRGKKAVPLA